MIVFLKSNALYAFYILGIIFFGMAIIGRVKWGLLFLIGLLPLRNVIEKLHAFPYGKDFIDILLLALMLGWIIGSIGRREKIMGKSALNSIAIILILYTFFSLIRGSFQLNYLFAFDISDPRVQAWKNFCILPLLFFLTFNCFKEEKWVWRVLVVVCLSMLIMDYYLVRQISWFTHIASRVKIKGTFVYLGPNEIAAFYNQYTLFFMSLFFFIKKRIVKLFLLGLIVTNLYCILFLFSRAAYIGLVVGMFFLFAVKDKKLLIPLVLVVVLWQTALPEKVRQRIEMTTDEYGNLDESSEKRLDLWQEAMELFKDSPVIGVGFGGFYYVGSHSRDTHNIYVKILAEQGIVGFIIFLILILKFFIQGVRLHAKGEDSLYKGVGLGFALCVIVLMVNNFFGDRWTYLPVSSNFWVFAGLVARLHILAEEKLQGKRSRN